MKEITEDLYSKIEKLTVQVRKDLYSKGLVIPVKNKNGSISVGRYTIKKTNSNFYIIVDHSGEIIVDQLNLPHTAAVLANGLALGKYLDKDLVQTDRYYGFALFEEQLHQRAVERSAKKSLDYFDIMLSKRVLNCAKKELYKQDIMKRFDKLKKIL
jgi:hypothetical protein